MCGWKIIEYKYRDAIEEYMEKLLIRGRKEIMNSVGVDGTTHSLRREFITTAYRADAQLLEIMRIVGHTDLRQTVKYIENDLDYMRETINHRKLYISNSIIT